MSRREAGRKGALSRWRGLPAARVEDVLLAGNFGTSVSAHTRRALQADLTRAFGRRSWRKRLTLAPSSLRHVTTGLPAGYGLFVACPDCPVRHAPVRRRPGEGEEAYWARATSLCACPHGTRRGETAWPTPVFPRGALVGWYTGCVRPLHTEGDYVLEVSRALLPSLAPGEEFTIDAGGTVGSLMRYCNGVESPLDKHCTVGVSVSQHAGLVLHAENGRASLPVVAARALRPHDELLLNYGSAYFATMKGRGEYVFSS
jgi:hypothetical protein